MLHYIQKNKISLEFYFRAIKILKKIFILFCVQTVLENKCIIFHNIRFLFEKTYLWLSLTLVLIPTSIKKAIQNTRQNSEENIYIFGVII